jgi:uncharacterized protein
VLGPWYREGRYQGLGHEEYMALEADFLSYLPDSVIIQRLMRDPYPEELIAPQWALKKQRNLAAIDAYLEERDPYQAKANRECGSVASAPSALFCRLGY